MKFRSNDVQGIFVYDLSADDGSYRWSEVVKDYYNKGDIVDVDFDVVIETHFTIDFLNGMFTPMDDEAREWAAPLLELTQTPEVVAA